MNQKKETNIKKTLVFNLNSFQILEDDEDISIVRLRLLHLGLNRNKCDISKECCDISIPTFFDKPIIYRLNNKYFPLNSTDVVEHSRDNDSTMFIAGHIPSTSEYRYVVDEDNGKTYLEMDGIVQKVYQPALMKILEDRKGNIKISIEIIVEDGKEEENGTMTIYKMKLRGIALLGDKIPEGIEGSCLNVVKFSENEFNEKYKVFSMKNNEVYHLTKENKNDIQNIKDLFINSNKRMTEKESIIINNSLKKDFINLKEANVIKLCFDYIKNDNVSFNIDWIDSIIENEVHLMSMGINELRELIWKQLDKYEYHDGSWIGKKYYVEEIYMDEKEIIVKDNETSDVYKIKYSIDGSEIKLDMDSKKKVKKTYEEVERNEDEVLNAYVFSKSTYGSGKKITLDKTKKSMSENAWGDVDKSAQRKEILDSPNYKTLVKSAYLEVPSDWENAPSKLGYPVMELVGDKLVYNRHALASAKGYAETNNDTEVINKLEPIYKKLGLDKDDKKEEKKSMSIKKNKLDEDNKDLEDIKDDVEADEDDEKEELEENKVKKNKIEKSGKGIEGLEDDEDADKDYWKKKYSTDMEIKNSEIEELKAKCNKFERKDLEEKMNALVEQYASCYPEEELNSLKEEIANTKTEEEFSAKVFACVAKNAIKEKEDKKEIKNAFVSPFGVNKGMKAIDEEEIKSVADMAKRYSNKGGNK